MLEVDIEVDVLELVEEVLTVVDVEELVLEVEVVVPSSEVTSISTLDIITAPPVAYIFTSKACSFSQVQPPDGSVKASNDVVAVAGGKTKGKLCVTRDSDNPSVYTTSSPPAPPTFTALTLTWLITPPEEGAFVPSPKR